MEPPRSIQPGHPSGEGNQGRSTLKDTPPTSLQRTPMTYQMSFGTWPRPLSCLAQPSMRLRMYGQGQTSCSKLTMHWGPCQRAWNSLEQYPHWSPQRLWAWWAYTIWTYCAISIEWPTALGAGRRAKMRAQLSTTSRQCIICSASCAINVSATHPAHQTPSSTTASRTTNAQEMEGPNESLV